MAEKKQDSVEEKRFPKNEYVKHKKPRFRRQESWRYKRVGDVWRKPHGVDSKMRKKVKGWPVSPTTGYRSPKKTRGLHPSGYVEVRVHSVEELGGIDPELQAIRVAHTVGGKKKLDIVSLAEEKGIHVINPGRLAKPVVFTEGEETEEAESLSDGEK
jgi:large subunit ribosomal protein L32e